MNNIRAATLAKRQQLAGGARLVFGKLPPLLQFAIKQAWASLFGALMLLALIVTTYIETPFNQYDILFVAAIGIQLLMLTAKLEKGHEVITIIVFHLTGLAMELFKTSPGIASWHYPGDAFFRIGTVPLFSGFMYAAVGSYIARSWRVLSLRLTNYPSRVLAALLAIAIYINFFTHHFAPDIRLILFALTIWLYRKTFVEYRFFKKVHRMPVLVGFVLIAFFIWIAENIGTFTKVWLYPDQVDFWQPVAISKLGSWLLLMIISFIMVETMHYLRTKKSNA